MPSVTVLAAYSKHKRDDVLPLRPDVAGLFAQWQTKRNEPINAKIFPNLDKIKTEEMLRKDFEIAGIDYIDEAGKVADFHSLRHTFISNLSQGGYRQKSLRVWQGIAP
jgi:integrase